MSRCYKLFKILPFMCILGIKAESAIEMWESNTVHPSNMKNHYDFRLAISNLNDLYKESRDIKTKFGKNISNQKKKKTNNNYYNQQHVGCLYNPSLKRVLGFKKAVIGYDPVLGFGPDYKNAIFSIYHINEDKNSPIVFLINNKELVKHFSLPEYNTYLSPMEKIPGLVNSFSQLKVATGPLSSRIFKIIGISAFYKNATAKNRFSNVTKNLNEYQEILIQSLGNKKFIGASGQNQPAKFLNLDTCELNPEHCIYIWIPYSKMNSVFSMPPMSKNSYVKTKEKR